MSEIDGILANSNGLEALNSLSTTLPTNTLVNDTVQSASSIQELEEMLKIIDNAAGANHPKITQAIETITNKIKDGASLNEIKTSAIR